MTTPIRSSSYDSRPVTSVQDLVGLANLGVPIGARCQQVPVVGAPPTSSAVSPPPQAPASGGAACDAPAPTDHPRYRTAHHGRARTGGTARRRHRTGRSSSRRVWNRPCRRHRCPAGADEPRIVRNLLDLRRAGQSETLYSGELGRGSRAPQRLHASTPKTLLICRAPSRTDLDRRRP